MDNIVEVFHVDAVAGKCLRYRKFVSLGWGVWVDIIDKAQKTAFAVLYKVSV